jgi:hypothetical protein
MEQEKEEESGENNTGISLPVEEEVVTKVEITEKDEEQKAKEEEERRRIREKERVSLERKYALPDDPAIIVYPSPTAKAGRFDCSVMSLSVLLDYRPEDNKEHSFEVSLFAELFNEMLMRDFGFRIYKALATWLDKVEEDKKKDEDRKKPDDKKDSDKKKDEGKKKDRKEEEVAEKAKDGEKIDKDEKKDAKTDTNEQQHLAATSDQPPVKKSKMDQDVDGEPKPLAPAAAETSNGKTTTKDDGSASTGGAGETKTEGGRKKTRSRWSLTGPDEPLKAEEDTTASKADNDSERKSSSKSATKPEKELMYSADKALLLACIYFDQTHTGYILDKDVEDIIHILGLKLSRAQVKKLVTKSISRDQFNYRKLTDKPVDKDGTSLKAGGGVVDSKDVDDRTLALGNMAMIGKQDTGNRDWLGSCSTEQCGDGEDQHSGVVMVNGTMIDVDSILVNLSKSEKARTDTETRMKTIEEDCAALRSNLTAAEQSRQKLSQELDCVRKQLRDQQQLLSGVQASARQRSSMLSRASTTLMSLASEINNVLVPSTITDKDSKDLAMDTVKSETVAETGE